MDLSLHALTFSGSVHEAISEAKRQKKLFIVYISGEDDVSTQLDKSTWSDAHVAECITKYCILLHILAGSADAENFSQIYPQKSAPCITAVGYNGVLVWQNVGCVSPENLASSLEKAWLSLHIQETTASVLTAALSSRNIGQFQNQADSGPTSASYERGDSLSGSSSMPSEDHLIFSNAEPLQPSQRPDQAEDIRIVQVSEEPGKRKDLKTDLDGKPLPVSEAVGLQKVDSGAVNFNNPEVCEPSNIKDQCSTPQDPKMSNDEHGILRRNSRSMNQDVKGGLDDNQASEQVDSYSHSKEENISADVLLNIRLPSGINLQEKFLKTSNLRSVKEYVERNLVDFSGSYDLAIPYPRKVFNDQDWARSLEELGIINRQLLIVVPHQRAVHKMQRGFSSSGASGFDSDANSAQGRIGGYFAFVKRTLSYVNPFAYLGGGGGGGGGGVSSSSASLDSGPEPTLHSNMGGQTRLGSSSDFNVSTSSMGHGSTRRRGFGGNIHTLKLDDNDDDASGGDNNTYWNGNSTQYGGNDDSR